MSSIRDIIDNEKDNYTMAKFLNSQLNNSENNGSFDISSGYFNISGYKLLQSSLWNFSKKVDFRLRLLFGKGAITKEENKKVLETITETSEISTQNVIEVENGSSVEEELQIAELEETAAGVVDDAIKFLKQDAVYVKSNIERFNHAKCYIFNTSAVIGSSNFTGAGLSGNVELNAVMRQGYSINDVKQWFERRWSNSLDSKEELIAILENSKFGLPLEPFKMYMKLLYEYYRPRLEQLEKGKESVIELTEFQRDAVISASRIIDKYGGVIISDSTGLGKTHIALSLLRQFVSVGVKRMLLVAPKQVIDGVWEPQLNKEHIWTTNESLEGTGAAGFDPTDYLDYDVVLIDESHNYRSSTTNRYSNMMKIISGGKPKKVILLTATPVNNSLIDLYNQISLITAGDDTRFVELGISDLRNYFISADRKQIASGVEDIVRLLDEIMIRRTRSYIKENYPDSTLEGKKITFPSRKLTKVEYSLTSVFGTTVYQQVIDSIDKLFLVPYRVPSYGITTDEEEKEKSKSRAALQKYGLLKRFESSIIAIRKSVTRLLLFYQTFERTLSQGKVMNSKIFQEILSDYLQKEEEFDEEEFFERLEGLTTEDMESSKSYNIKQMKVELSEDIKLLKSLKINLDKTEQWSDAKLDELMDLFERDKVFESGGKKVVIFTQFVDTAQYLEEKLRTKRKDKNVVLLTGKTNLDTRKNILMEFAPKSNNPLGKFIEAEADILVASDVLSEGQNLQDANYVINYDLPWNPMKIVQRVGRVDRLTSQHQIVTSAVFFPEKELEAELGLLIKLTKKIQQAAHTVGLESSILGEKESPKTFNAFERLKNEDSTLLDDMERSSELLSSTSPYHEILSYLKKIGETELKSIPYGKRSGKEAEQSGLIMCYKEKRTNLLHFLFYDSKHNRFENVNNLTWIFRMLKSQVTTQLKIPFEGLEAIRYIRMVDSKAREEILLTLNAPIEAKKTQRIKAKYQRFLHDILFDAFNTGKASHEEILEVFKLIIKDNYPAWEREFKEYYENFQQDNNIANLTISIKMLFKKWKIETRELAKEKELRVSDLILVGCMFLVNPGFKGWNILGT